MMGIVMGGYRKEIEDGEGILILWGLNGEQWEIVAATGREALLIGEQRVEQGADGAAVFAEQGGELSGSQRAIGGHERIEDSLAFGGDETGLRGIGEVPAFVEGIIGEGDL